jgi:hypothetical protein
MFITGSQLSLLKTKKKEKKKKKGKKKGDKQSLNLYTAPSMLVKLPFFYFYLH